MGVLEPSACVCLCLPWQLASAITNGSFHHVMLCARQMRQQRLFQESLPFSFFQRNVSVVYYKPAAVSRDVAQNGLDKLLHDLIEWRPHLLSLVSQPASSSHIDLQLTQHIELIRSLRGQQAGLLETLVKTSTPLPH